MITDERLAALHAYTRKHSVNWPLYVVIRLAFVPKAVCAGSYIRCASLTGAIRGQSETGPEGETVRPDLVLIDDPQDREAATSPAQCDDRE